MGIVSFRRSRCATLATGAGALMVIHPVALAQFSGSYAPSQWTFNANGGDGAVILSAAPDAITLIGNNNGLPLIDTDYTVVAPATGSWSFDWMVEHSDTGTYDTAYYLINGESFFINDNNTHPHVGSFSNILVHAGDFIGFRVHSSDGAFGALELTISSFVAPVPTPGPVGAVVAAAVWIGPRRRRAATHA